MSPSITGRNQQFSFGWPKERHLSRKKKKINLIPETSGFIRTLRSAWTSLSCWRWAGEGDKVLPTFLLEMLVISVLITFLLYTYVYYLAFTLIQQRHGKIEQRMVEIWNFSLSQGWLPLDLPSFIGSMFGTCDGIPHKELWCGLKKLYSAVQSSQDAKVFSLILCTVSNLEYIF